MINFVKELATSTVAVAPSPATSGTSLTVETGKGSRFPVSPNLPFFLVAHPDNELPTEDNAEFLRVTAVSGDTMTIERAAMIGSVAPSAKSIATGWRVSLPVISSDLDRANCTGFVLYSPGAGFSVGDAIACDYTDSSYYKAIASSSSTAEVVGVVSSIIDDQYEIITSGHIVIGTTYSGSGPILFLSPTVDGQLTYTEPTTPGHISKPVVTVRYESGVSTEGYVNLMRGMEIDEGWASTSVYSDSIPTGAVNGSNTAYTCTSPYMVNTLEVFINGLKQIRNTDYTETGPSTGDFSMTTAPATGDIIRVNYMNGSFGVGNSDKLDGYDASELMTPIGTVVDFAGSTAPTGWLLCYGQAVSRTTYAALYSIIGTTYGVGNGTTTFNLPDARGRVIAGKDDMGGTSANRLTNQSGGLDGDTLGANGGAETHTLSLAQIPNATGSVTMHGGESGSSVWAPTGVFSGSTMQPTYRSPGTVNSGANSIQVMNFSLGGGGGAHNNVQPTLIFNKIIRAL